MAEPGLDSPRKTRVVIVVYDGKLVAERYAPGFSKTTPLLGWSMSKSIPSRKLVLARLGNSSSGDAWDDEKFISEVLAALPKP